MTYWLDELSTFYQRRSDHDALSIGGLAQDRYLVDQYMCVLRTGGGLGHGFRLSQRLKWSLVGFLKIHNHCGELSETLRSSYKTQLTSQYFESKANMVDNGIGVLDSHTFSQQTFMSLPCCLWGRRADNWHDWDCGQYLQTSLFCLIGRTLRHKKQLSNGPPAVRVDETLPPLTEGLGGFRNWSVARKDDLSPQLVRDRSDALNER